MRRRLPRHGTISRYTNQGCRCSACRRANRERQREYMHRTGRSRPMHVYLASIAPDHGTYTMYSTHGCRCEVCRQGATERRRRARVRAAGSKVYCAACGGVFVNHWGLRVHASKMHVEVTP